MGENHPDIAKSLFNLGLILKEQGKWAEAEGDEFARGGDDVEEAARERPLRDG